MKHFNQSNLLAYLFPLLLIIPNIALAITEQDNLASKITDVILPIAVYGLLMTLSRNVARTVLFCLPLMILAAFQIVLIYLYGESIIAIDMFLNVVTTNTKEVGELLGNLIIAIVTVVVIYLPPIVYSIVLIIRRDNSSCQALKKLRRISLVLLILGGLSLIAAYATSSRYSMRRNIFPVNVICNLFDAAGRTVQTANYHKTSADFSYHAASTRSDSLPEIYVVVVGETSRADNWQLLGYNRPTNPRLSQRDNLVAFSKAMSESNTTHKSVPMLLSHLTADTFGDSITLVKGISEAFREAGFATAYFSNQQRNHSFIDFFGLQADTTVFVKDSASNALDETLVEQLRSYLAKNHNQKTFVILHTYGSHFLYRERYDDKFRVFKPESATEATAENRDQLINAYDNTILYTDTLLDDVISAIDSLDIPAAMIYTSDHGEDIFDDYRNRFLHASPTPTFTQLHVPMLIWTSDSYNNLYPEKLTTARHHSDLPVSSSSSMFHTIMSLAGITSPYSSSELDLCSPSFTPRSLRYLDDYNEGLPLKEAGLREPDFERANLFGVSLD